MDNQQQHDEILWQLAKRRAAFKASLSAYIIVNVFLIAIWYFTSGTNSYFWPKWPALGWGIGIVLQYIGAYQVNNMFSAEKEYEQLKQQKI